MDFSMLPGLPVFSPSGESLGYVLSAYLSADLSALSALVCADGEEEEFVLPARAVLSARDAVVAGAARLKEPTGTPCPAGRPVFHGGGGYLGVAEGLTGGKDGVLFVRGLGGVQIYSASRLAVSDAVIVYPHPEKPPRRRARQTPARPKKPEKEGTYRADLLGRPLRLAVTGERGETIAAAGERVTPAILQRARERNRLLELAASVLTDSPAREREPDGKA